MTSLLRATSSFRSNPRETTFLAISSAGSSTSLVHRARQTESHRAPGTHREHGFSAASPPHTQSKGGPFGKPALGDFRQSQLCRACLFQLGRAARIDDLLNLRSRQKGPPNSKLDGECRSSEVESKPYYPRIMHVSMAGEKRTALFSTHATANPVAGTLETPYIRGFDCAYSFCACNADTSARKRGIYRAKNVRDHSSATNSVYEVSPIRIARRTVLMKRVANPNFVGRLLYTLSPCPG
jgi:hypothetical protein